jgi:hypothetical protein
MRRAWNMEKSEREKEPKFSGSRSAKRLKAATAKIATKMPITAKALITAGAARTGGPFSITAIAESLPRRRPGESKEGSFHVNRVDGLVSRVALTEKATHFHRRSDPLATKEQRDSLLGASTVVACWDHILKSLVVCLVSCHQRVCVWVFGSVVCVCAVTAI